MKETTKRARAMSDAELARKIPQFEREVRNAHSLLFAMKQERQRRAEAANAEAKRA